MPTQFSQTTRSLAADRSPLALVAWCAGALFLAGWGAWFALGEVTVTENSVRARLEIQQLPHHVSPPLAGQISRVSVAIGQRVAAGDVLVELDMTQDRLRLAEEQTRLDGLPARVASLRKEIVALDGAGGDAFRASQAAVEAARARVQEMEAAIAFARQNERRLREQSSAGGIAQIEALRAVAEVQKLVAGREALAADIRRLELEAQTQRQDSQARIETLARGLITLEGEVAASRAAIARLEGSIAQQVLRTPVAGVVGDMAPMHPGAYVTAGQRLVSVVPPGALLVIGEFAPSSALGRLRPGQRGQMRLDGFPWAEFGSIDAEASRVASEIRDNLVRVEFTPRVEGRLAGIAQHGLPGTIAVEIEKVAPATLLLRAAGLWLSAPPRAGVGERAR